MIAQRLRLFGLALLAFATLGWAHHIDRAPAPAEEPGAQAPSVSIAGVVEELVVEDAVLGSSQRFQVLVAEDGRPRLLKGPAAVLLEAGASVVVVGKTAGTTLFAREARIVGRADATAPRAKSAERINHGTLRLGHRDNFDGQPSEFFFTLFADAGEPRDVALATDLGLLDNGMRVTVSGRLDANGELLATHIVIDGPAPAVSEPQQKATVTTQVLVLPIKFKDVNNVYPADPFTITSLSSAVFGAAPTQSVAEYYKEVSYGQQLIAGTVAQAAGGGWLLSSIAAPTPAACDYNLIGTEAEARATAAGYNLANYPFRVYVFAQSGFSCGWAGLAYVSWGRSWIKNTTSLLVIGHELGHNFGLLHAGSRDCGASVVGGSCSVSEYGDPFDIMGNNRAMHFNAMQKRILNWIPDTSTPTHATGTTTYSLTPIETAGGARYAVRIPAATKRTYWIEFRQPIGFDAGLSAYPNNGAQLRLAYPFESTSGSDDTQFLDATPATSAMTDGAIVAGQSFSDPAYGVTINVLSASPTSLSVQVTNSGPFGSDTTMSASPYPSTTGSNATLTAWVSGKAPTGTVAFKTGSTTISGCGSAALSGAGDQKTATCTTSALAEGVHPLTATYGGDGANTASTSPTVNHVVVLPGQALTTTTLASSVNPSAVGQNVTFTATVNGSAPTGNVAFKNGSSTIATCAAVPLAGSGNSRTAACALASLGQGTHSITASYAGNATNAMSSSAAVSQVVKLPSTTAVSSSVNPSAVGQSVTFTATVTGSGPTGNVAFRDGGTNISGCSAVALGGAGNTRTATCTTSALAQGNRSITAAYAGDGVNLASTSSALTQVVGSGPVPTTTALASTLNPSTVGASVTFTATVTGVNPTGNVAFKDGANNISGCSGVALTGSGNSRTAQCTSTTLTQGTHSITAVYAGDAGNLTSTSAALSQVVNAAAASTNVALAANGGVASASSAYNAGFAASGTNNGDVLGTGWGSGGGWNDNTGNAWPDWLQVNFSGQKTINKVVVYTVQDNYAAPSTPTDSMTFSLYGITGFQVQTWNGSTWVTQATVSGNNLVKRTVTFAAVTTDRIRINVTSALASYSRIVEVEAWSAAGSGPVATTTALASTLNPSTVGASVTFTATVTGVNPTGNVAFKDGANNISGCSGVALAGSGNSRTAQCTTTTLTQGTHSITAVYAGDAGNLTSTSTALSQVVNAAAPAATTTALASTLNPSTVGASVTFTATVTGVSPTGNVAFKDGANNISGCSGVALAGSGNSRTAQCTTTTLTQGTHSITAVYVGDAGNLTSTSAALSQVVNAAAASTNVALAANGGVASASSAYNAGFAASGTNNGDVLGTGWGSGGGWNDNTGNAWPDWLQVNFSGQKTINKVVVYTVQDNYAAPSTPTDSMTFSLYGITGFQVQTWNGSTWVTQATVSGNNLVKRTVTFAAVTTDRIRINVTSALASYSRIVEAQAWTQ